MKYKKMLKRDLDKNDVEGFHGKMKLYWGYLTFYARRNIKNKWSFELYWTNTDTGQDNTLAIKKNRAYDSIDDLFYEMTEIARDYFEDHEMLEKIMNNIGEINEERWKK